MTGVTRFSAVFRPPNGPRATEIDPKCLPNVNCRWKLYPHPIFLLSVFEQTYFKMRFEELHVIGKMTGCGKPCSYREYKFHGEKLPTSFKSSGDHYIFSLLAQTRHTSIWKEELLYPPSTMVAEVGGILSLFLGVSFMTIWDGAILVKKYVFALKSFLHESFLRK